MVSGFQVDLDPDDLQLGSNVSTGAAEEADTEVDKQDKNYEVSHVKSDVSSLDDFDIGDSAARTFNADMKPKKNMTDSEKVISLEVLVGVSEMDIQDSEPFASSKTNKSAKVGFRDSGEEKKEDEDKMDSLDDWLSGNNTIANPYVSTSTVMPDGVDLDDSDDAEEGKDDCLVSLWSFFP